MKWSNLKRNLCPQCGEDITRAFNPQSRLIECECGFKISQAKMGLIVSDRVNQEIEDEHSGREETDL
jgi:hypothetical protein